MNLFNRGKTMKLDSIFTLWEADSKISITDLSNEAVKIPQLHHKYLRIMTHEKLVLMKIENEYKQLHFEKKKFLEEGASTKEELIKWKEKNKWNTPPKGRTTKRETDSYIEVDNDIIAILQKIGIQKEKVEILSSIINQINQRSFQIKDIIAWERFKTGLN
jgi:hypothetical protein